MYSAHDILDISITKKDDHLEASWWYKFRNDDAAKAPLRFGKLVLFDDAAICGGWSQCHGRRFRR